MSSSPTRFAAPVPSTRAASAVSPAPRPPGTTPPRTPGPRTRTAARPAAPPGARTPLPRSAAPVHAPADHQPGPQPRTEVQIGERAALAPDRQPERHRVGVLVHDDGHRPSRSDRESRSGNPSHSGNPVTRCSTPAGGRAARAERRPRPAGTPGAALRNLRRQFLHRRRDPPQYGLRTGPQIQRRTPSRHHRPVEVGQHGPQLVTVQVHAHRVPGLRHQPQHRAGLAARGRAAPGLGGEALLTQPGGDLADRLRVSPVRSASSSRLMPSAPAVRSRSSTSAVLWLRRASRLAPPFAPRVPEPFAPRRPAPYVLFTRPLWLALALWQQRCESRTMTGTPPASASWATASRVPCSTPR